ncbi:hypothetical protein CAUPRSCDRAFT_12722 [Caulochytrium protostelioides]|nr:hypothetical protein CAUPRSCDRAFT_12722 [Caulochytrium protostelioides]
MPTLFDGDLMINQKVKREFVWRSDQGFSKAKLEGIRSLADDLKCAYMMDDGTIVLEPCTDDAVLTDKVRLGMYPIQPEVNKLTYVIGGSRAKDNKVTKFNCVLKNINEVRGNKSVSNECLEDVNNNKYDRCNCETFRVTIAPPVVGEPKVVRDEL